MKGAEAEDRALAHLLAQGHVLLARNYRIRGGEIDLITRVGHVVVFTEVKHRSRASHGAALEGVTQRKLDLLRRAATRYLLHAFGHDQVFCRFDVIAITGSVVGGELQHVQDVG